MLQIKVRIVLLKADDRTSIKESMKEQKIKVFERVGLNKMSD